MTSWRNKMKRLSKKISKLNNWIESCCLEKNLKKISCKNTPIWEGRDRLETNWWGIARKFRELVWSKLLRLNKDLNRRDSHLPSTIMLTKTKRKTTRSGSITTARTKQSQKLSPLWSLRTRQLQTWGSWSPENSKSTRDPSCWGGITDCSLTRNMCQTLASMIPFKLKLRVDIIHYNLMCLGLL